MRTFVLITVSSLFTGAQQVQDRAAILEIQESADVCMQRLRPSGGPADRPLSPGADSPRGTATRAACGASGWHLYGRGVVESLCGFTWRQCLSRAAEQTEVFYC